MKDIIINSPANFKLKNNLILTKNEKVSLEEININYFTGELNFSVLTNRGEWIPFKYSNIWEALEKGWDVLPIINDNIEF